MKTKYAFLIFCCIFLLQTNVNAQDGKLDSSFGVNGYVTTSITKNNIAGNSSAKVLFIQPDNKIVLYGFATIAGSAAYIFTRYNANGSVDSVFGNQGKAVLKYISPYPTAYNLSLLQPDGKLLFGGSALIGSIHKMSLMRYSPDGSLDSSFGTNGMLLIAIGYDDQAQAMAIQPDGKILLAGSTYTGANQDFGLIRFKPDGTLDSTFNSTGIAITPIGSSNDAIFSIAINSVGKIIVAGSANNGSNDDFAVACYQPNGWLDSTFGTNGKVTTIVGPNLDRIDKIVLQPDGKIIAYGISLNGSTTNKVILRYNVNGTVDGSYGTSGKIITYSNSTNIAIQLNGKVIVSGTNYLARYLLSGVIDSSYGVAGKVTPAVDSDYTDAISSMGMDSNGKIVTAGNSVFYSNTSFALARYDTTGNPDISFGSSHIIRTQFGSSPTYANEIVAQQDGKILLAGSSKPGTNYLDMLLARYNVNGAIDNTFGTNGIVNVDFNGLDDEAKALKIQNDGKIIIAGYASAGTKRNFALVRFNSNGSLDSTFGSNGKVVYSFTPAYKDYISSIALQSNGKIISIVRADTGTNNMAPISFGLFRFLSNGSIDSAFGINGKVNPTFGSSITIQNDDKIVLTGGDKYATQRFNANGSVDSTFNGGNKFTYFDSCWLLMSYYAYNFCHSVSSNIQSDGKIIIAASHSYVACNGNLTYSVALRLNANGIRDNTFGTNGFSNGFISSGSYTTALMLSGALQKDDKFIVLGSSSYYSAGNLALSRFQKNGTKDSSFGSSGNAISGFNNSTNTTYNPVSCVIVNDSCIVTAGSGYVGSGTSFAGMAKFKISASPYSDFIASIRYGNPTSVIQFTDKSKLTPTARNWSFIPSTVTYVNGTSDSSQNPQVRFNSNGTYSVTLASTFPTGTVSITKSNYITIDKSIANFYSVKRAGDTTTVFNFIDSTTNSPNSWSWSFIPNNVVYQNGTTLHSQNPSLKFTSTGNYNVGLKVTNSYGYDSIFKTTYISIGLKPLANFSANKFIGNSSTVFNFIDSSVNAPTSWNWSFSPNNVAYQNGTSANSQNPSVKFISTGSYTIILKVSSAFGSDSIVKINNVVIGLKPSLNFSVNYRSGNTGSNFNFIDNSTNSPTSWYWRFSPNNILYQNGTSSTSQNPDVKFTANGNYSVSLVVSNIYGVDSITKTNYITIGLKPVAGFSANANTGNTSTIFSFIDSSLNSPGTWSWSYFPNNVIYQNGTNSTSQHPIVRFSSNGVYSVKLVVNNLNGSDSIVNANYIIIGPKPIVKFSSNLMTGNTTTVFNFTDSSINSPTSWNWSFSPNNVSYQSSTTSSSQNPSVNFTALGTYSVSLMAANLFGSDSLIKTNIITITNVGIEQLDRENQIQIYPNPGNGVFDVIVNNNVNEKYQLSLYDLTGKLIYERNDFSDHGTIDISFASKGIYILSLKSDNVLFKRKLIIN